MYENLINTIDNPYASGAQQLDALNQTAMYLKYCPGSFTDEELDDISAMCWNVQMNTLDMETALLARCVDHLAFVEAFERLNVMRRA